jgi:2-aminoadipate transaminase
MGIRFARRTAGFRASAVLEMLKLTAQREVIPFGGGLPPRECFPLARIEAVLSAVLRRDGAAALQYSTTEGIAQLRQQISAQMLARCGTQVEADQVLVTTGSQQALDLAGKVFLDEGDAVFCESPTYLAAISAFRSYVPDFVCVPSDQDGMLPSALEEAVASHPRRKLVYVVPEFQNPSGRTWSLARRRALLEIARLHDLPVIEDSPYRELRFEGEQLPSLASLDVDGRVVFTSTFSKVLSPGIRVGWVCASPIILDRFVLAKQGADLHTSTLSQMLVATYLERHGLDDHLARVRHVCRERRDAMLAAVAELLPAEVRVSRPAGGLFLWLELPAGLSSRQWLKRCIDRGVAFVPGDAFFPNGGGEGAARLCYSDTVEARIVLGVSRMAAALRELDGARSLCWPQGALSERVVA